MNDIWVVARKEFREQLRQGRDLLRYVWLAVVVGALFPLRYLSQGAEALILGSVPWLVYAGFITASGATLGAFFVERQRGTLETLLASPLSETAIFVGKVIFSLLVSLFSAVAAAVVELGVINLVLLISPRSVPALHWPFGFPALACFGLLVALPAILLYGISTGTLISLRADNMRTAGLLSMLAVLPLAVPLGLLALLVPPGLSWRFVLALTATMLAIDAVALRAGLALFSRQTVVLNIPG